MLKIEESYSYFKDEPGDYYNLDGSNDMMIMYLTIRAPFYWWKEFDTYKVATICNSCGIMHEIHTKPFKLGDFSWESLSEDGLTNLECTVDLLESKRQVFLTAADEKIKKQAWNEIIKLLPSCYEQRRNVMLSYKLLANIYKWRRNNELSEWHTFCNWIEKQPYSELITG